MWVGRVNMDKRHSQCKMMETIAMQVMPSMTNQLLKRVDALLDRQMPKPCLYLQYPA